MQQQLFAEQLSEILTETQSSFPGVDKNIKLLIGKTVFKNHKWHKALVLCKDRSNRLQLRFYAWQKYKNSTWKVRQKYNIALSHLNSLCNMLFDINNVFEREAERKYLEKRKQEEGTLPPRYEARLKELLLSHEHFQSKK